MSDTTTLRLRLANGREETAEISRELRDRIERAARQRGEEPGELWLYAMRTYGEQIQPDLTPEVYEACETKADARGAWIREVFRRGCEEVLDRTPTVHANRIDRELT